MDRHTNDKPQTPLVIGHDGKPFDLKTFVTPTQTQLDVMNTSHLTLTREIETFAQEFDDEKRALKDEMRALEDKLQDEIQALDDKHATPRNWINYRWRYRCSMINTTGT